MVDVSVLVAGGVLLVGVVILLALRGRRRDIVATAESAVTTGSTPVIPTAEPDSAATPAPVATSPAPKPILRTRRYGGTLRPPRVEGVALWNLTKDSKSSCRSC